MKHFFLCFPWGFCEGRTILCVDDEVTRLSIRKIDAGIAGYRALTAGHGEDVQGCFLSEAIDLVVLDYSMPKLRGGPVAEEMRELSGGQHGLSYRSAALAAVQESQSDKEPS